jgi:hypothetical protein
MKVVVLGPKFWKKLARQYSTTNQLESLLVLFNALKAKPDTKSYKERPRPTVRAHTHDDEKTSEDDEAHQLYRFTSPRVDEKE